jgi:hypothetical protein
MEKQFENSNAAIHIDKEAKAVVVVWKKITLEEYKEVLNKGLEILKENGYSNWFADTTNHGAVNRELQEWVDKDWTPRALQGGLKRLTYNLPASVLSQMSIESLVQVMGDVTIHAFGSYDEAKKWLMS